MRTRISAAVLPLLLLAVQAFANDPLLTWIKSPEAYFATSEEIARWSKEVVTAQDAQTFIDEYFRKRGEQFKKDLHTRIEFADSKFTLPKIPGSRTQMGRVFILLGSPNEERTRRGGTSAATMSDATPRSMQRGNPGVTAVTSPLNNRLQDSEIERGSKVTYTWIYKTDRLPAALSMPELKIDFNTDTARGQQFIENPGLVEPYLRRAAEHFSARYARASATRSEQIARPVTSPTRQAPDPLWNAISALNGAVYTGEAFVSPTDAPFYAVSFFLPKDAASFKEWKSGLFVSLVRDLSGRELVAQRQQVDLQEYDRDGNRYVDRALALPPGAYEGMFAIFSPDGIAMLASYRERFDVPAANAPRASRLLLSSHVETLDQQGAFDPFTFVAQKYAVRGDNRFRASDKIALFTVVANPTGSPVPQLMQQMSFSRDGKTIAKMPLERAQLTQTGPNTFLLGAAFDPGTFKPGHYKVELQVRDFNAPEGSELRTKGYVLISEFDVQ